MTPRARAGRGFTLVEVLVALAILAAMAMFAWRATASLVEGEARLSGEAQRWQRLDAVFARLDADLRGAVPRPVRVGPLAREPAFAGTASAIAFTRAGSAPSEPGADGTRLAYRLAGGTLEILYWPRLDRAAGVEPAAYALASGVARFDVRYADEDGAWTDRWPPVRRDDLLPAAVALTLTLDDGARVERLVALR
jgi:general secretion pathway protein J